MKKLLFFFLSCGIITNCSGNNEAGMSLDQVIESSRIPDESINTDF